ncbi:MAG: LPS export ABC transporter periplasmic protein LptC [Paramuribaculum sp.]|nr:LPS export ABC transporter periplasmic protein LptC [Paramuribaculum sp.]
MSNGRIGMLVAGMAAALLCVGPSLLAAGGVVSEPVLPPRPALSVSVARPDTVVRSDDKTEAETDLRTDDPKPRGLVKGVGRDRANRPQIKPVLPEADRTDGSRVFLEYADTLRYVKPPVDYLTGLAPEPYQLLLGNVKLRKEGMWMFCDSAHFYETGDNFRAYGNVRMEQGDTLFVYGDELEYTGADELATLYGYNGRKVRMINRDVKLTTDVLNYSLADKVGYYDVGGELTDKSNHLVSREGEYYPDSKMAYFYRNVVLTGLDDNDTLKMYTDTLEYNTSTSVATIVDRTLIISKDGEIVTTSGNYATQSGFADLFSRSTVHTRRGNTLTGDTIFYDRNRGFGEAFGMVVMTDSARKSMIEGDYAFYDELSDSAFVTGRALVKEYSHGDTLYMHGDTIIAYTDPVDSAKVTNVFHKVRFYRSDLQGLCDSLSYAGSDSVIYMYRHPVVWSGERQIFGNTIMLHLNDSTVDWARLPDFAFVAEHLGEDCFNQLTGSDMTAWFDENSDLRRLYVEGNLNMINFPMENDSTYNKFAFVESTNLDCYFKNNTIDHAHVWPQNEGNVTPLYLAKRNSYILDKFAWYGDLRPLAPGDVFIVPQGMLDLIASAPPVEQRKRVERGDAAPSESAPEDRDLIPGVDSTLVNDSLPQKIAAAVAVPENEAETTVKAEADDEVESGDDDDKAEDDDASSATVASRKEE